MASFESSSIATECRELWRSVYLEEESNDGAEPAKSAAKADVAVQLYLDRFAEAGPATA